MAVAMEVSWRGGVELARKKRAWGADAQQLVHLMMGQLQHSQLAAVKPELTLDLLGAGAADPISSPSCVAQSFDLQAHPEELPLPSGWEKFLDLKTGKLYYVNRATGVRSFDDPRKRPASEAEVQTKPLAHEFLGSKRSELESLRASSSSTSSGSPHASGRDSFASGRQLWSLQLDDRCGSRDAGEASNLELDLNLSFASRPRPQGKQQQAVCTMQMVENALRRSESSPRLRRDTTTSQRHKHNSISSSFSSLTNSTRSDPGNSPATSSSSSGSSTSFLPGANPRSTGACTEVKVESASSPAAALVMGACTRCLMFVMLNKGDPRCPRCESKVPLGFASPFKKQRSGPRDHRR